MQTKKRAKPVKFGKETKKEEPKVVKEPEEKLEKAKVSEEAPEEIKLPKRSPHKEASEEKEEADFDEETSDNSDSESATETDSEETEQTEQEEEEKLEKEIEEPTKPSPFGSFTYESEKIKAKKGSFGFFFLVAFLTFLLGLAVISAISYLMPNQKESLKVVMQQETPTPTPAENVTPTPDKIDFSAYSLEVLNGSGTTGEAAKVQYELEQAGFTVKSVGNADSSDYTKTVVTAKKTVEQKYLDTLITILKKGYVVNAVVESAPASQTNDVVVTIGSSTAK